ncbi:M23 family metallopeptidase [Saccharopolyspora taberi]|uniref:M23ase beta-sheet core domain-containing protein n=1 Tax=Saccharopolyspora taberi TaxID=60895 RepID=A0ABN3VBB2_9PSEU
MRSICRADWYVRMVLAQAGKYLAQQGMSATGDWVIPVSGTCTSGFGPRDGEFHAGQDIANTVSTPIAAARDGTVIDSGPASGYGLWVRIAHVGGVVSRPSREGILLDEPGFLPARHKDPNRPETAFLDLQGPLVPRIHHLMASAADAGIALALAAARTCASTSTLGIPPGSARCRDRALGSGSAYTVRGTRSLLCSARLALDEPWLERCRAWGWCPFGAA